VKIKSVGTVDTSQERVDFHQSFRHTITIEKQSIFVVHRHMTRLSVYVIVNDEVPKKTWFLAPSHYFSYLYRKPLKMKLDHEIIKDAICLQEE
jgi:hypothetical protein